MSDSLCSQKANEVLVFLLADLDRIHKPEIPNAFPIAYAFKGYSMKATVMRTMIEDVLHELYLQGIYTPVISYDGQWAVLAYKAKDGEALTLLELQKQVYNEVKATKKNEVTKLIFETGVVKPDETLSTQIDYVYDEQRKAVYVAQKAGIKLFRTSSNTQHLLATVKTNVKNVESKNDESDGNHEILSVVPTEILNNLNDDEIQVLQDVDGRTDRSQQTNTSNIYQETVNLQDTIFADIELGDDDGPSGTKGIDACQLQITEQIQEMELDDDPIYVHVQKEQIPITQSVLNKDDIKCMLASLQSDDKAKVAWKNRNVDEFEIILADTEKTKSALSRYEMTICLNTVADTLNKANIRFSKYWNKSKMANLLQNVITQTSVSKHVPTRTRRRRNPDKLTTLCKKTINSIPKVVLNAVVAEYKMIDRIKQWREKSPFASVTEIGSERVAWFSSPEYNSGTLSYIFSFIDVHHLITNCRVKICKDGLFERGISKQAWIYVAKSNTTKLKLPHVEDLVDKQSDSVARETFSEDVENAMRSRYPRESNFCKLIREFYEAEDDPGIGAEERCNRRMALRTWLLEGVNFCRFPPYGSHIRGIPNVMFQGFLTNIERRLQLFPYVKSGAYNVRSLGSLEAENLFGQFQDLDPRGSGVIKAEEIPYALDNACQLLRTMMLPNRPFHMSLSKAKVYPVHELMTESGMDYGDCCQYVCPSHITKITVRNHMFDAKSRGKRKARRRLVDIKGPHEAARGVSGVRQYHKCDESKILAHKRLGIDV